MNQTNVHEIDVHELKKRMDKDPDLCLIDVRESDEWAKGHISSATHLPKDSLLEQIEGLVPDRSQAVYLHCQGGVRSMIAANWLAHAGYLEVYSVAGGLSDWVSKGYPVVCPK